MAKCCYCGKEIGLYLYQKGQMLAARDPEWRREYYRDIFRIKSIFCPTCGMEIRPTWVTFYGCYLAMCLPIPLVVHLFGGTLMIFVGILFLWIIGILFWKYLGRFE